jgi:tetratricopeptide (TPR) repeat protein
MLTRFTAQEHPPNPQVMVSSNGTPAAGATGRLYVHTNAGLARYELGPVPALGPPTPERLHVEKIACAKQTVRALRAQGDPGRPALAAALIALDGLLAEAGRISEAVMTMEEAVQTYRDISASPPDNADYLNSLIASLYILAARYSEAGQRNKSAGLGDEAVKAAARVENAGASADVRRNVASNLDQLSGYLPSADEAVRVAEKATAMFRALAGPGSA